MWIARQLADDIARYAAAYPTLETGGMLLGYWAVGDDAGDSSADEVVVVATIGPGPQAQRGRTWLRPDHDWQLRQLEDAYVQSGRTVTYLGDWHTHPGGAPVPSRRDRRTMRAVRRSSSARTPRPLMMIVGPEPSSAPVMWCLTAGRLPRRATLNWF